MYVLVCDLFRGLRPALANPLGQLQALTSPFHDTNRLVTDGEHLAASRRPSHLTHSHTDGDEEVKSTSLSFAHPSSPQEEVVPRQVS
jgi:hypothetical protein